MSKNILITGITGFLGRYIAKELLNNGYKIFALARAMNNKTATQRVYEALDFAFDDECKSDIIQKRVVVIEGDITRTDFGIKITKESTLMNNKIDIVYHCAALTNLAAPLEFHRMVNVEGTRNILELAMNLKKRNPLLKMCHISTIFVAGKYKEKFAESDLENKQSFNNFYEQSKYEAEKLLKEYVKKGLNIVTFRPSIIVGDYKKGKTSNFRLIYQPLRHFIKGIFKKYPGDLNCKLNIINVDKVALSIFSLAENGEMPVYHIVSANSITLSFLLESAKRYFKFKPPEFIPAASFNQSDLTSVQREIIKPFIPYLNCRTKIIAEDTLSQLCRMGIILPQINANNLIRLFSYCKASGFIRR